MSTKNQLYELKLRIILPSFNRFTYSLNQYLLSTLLGARGKAIKRIDNSL